MARATLKPFVAEATSFVLRYLALVRLHYFSRAAFFFCCRLIASFHLTLSFPFDGVCSSFSRRSGQTTYDDSDHGGSTTPALNRTQNSIFSLFRVRSNESTLRSVSQSLSQSVSSFFFCLDLFEAQRPFAALRHANEATLDKWENELPIGRSVFNLVWHVFLLSVK